MTDLHTGTFVTGLVFALIGLVLLLDVVDVLDLDAGLLVPVLLIGTGLAMLASWVVGRAGGPRDRAPDRGADGTTSV